ncbi:MAG: two-component system, OmpR family, alkaline phosphatase synthesis response regulator PhoP [Fimbriimonadaceae bacterium]|nr:two-component system, OmpR family, alkaline phosphatase synthesis response regulator PhoP [Fimbriimonadaceae bacterium]
MCDDERHIVRLIQRNLERQGHIVLTSFDGSEALAILRREAVDFLVIDARLTAPTAGEVLAAMAEIPGLENVRVELLERPV